MWLPQKLSIRSLVSLARLVLVLGFVLAGLVSEAGAASKSRKQREAQARIACDSGRVEEGIVVLAELFNELKHPNYLYNQARCYQQNGRAEESINRFREYLRVAPNPSAENRARVEQFIAELQEEIRARAPAAPAPAAASASAVAPAPAAPTPIAPPAPAAAAAPPVVVVPQVVPPPPSKRSRALKVSTIALGGVAALGIAGGVAAGLQVRALEGDAEKPDPGQFDTDKLNEHGKRAKRFETFQWVSYGVGGAALAAATALLIFGPDEHHADGASVHISGQLRAGGAPELFLSGRF